MKRLGMSGFRVPSAFLVPLLLLLSAAPAAQASFGAESFTARATNADTTLDNFAGTHPYAFTVHLALNGSGSFSEGDLRDFTLELPRGVLFNPTAVGECSLASFATPRVSPYEESHSGESCPNSTQIGVAAVHSSFSGGTTRYFGIFNLVPPFGKPAAIGLAPFGMPIALTSEVRESDAGLNLNLRDLSQAVGLKSMDLTIWGTPWQGAHDNQRGNCLREPSGGSWGGCLVFDAAPAPSEQIHSFVTLPTTPCGSPMRFAISLSSWQGQQANAEYSSGKLTKCNEALSIPKVQLMTDEAAARTGLRFALDVNDGGGILNPGGTARPAIKKAVVQLPEGLTINPSLGSGLGTCSEADFARESTFSAPGAGCPNKSKIGDIAVEGMLGLEEPLKGSMFVATPYKNPFGSLIALYMVASNPRRGLFAKSIGQVEPDPRTGRLVATFDNLPRVLYTHFVLTFREGQRSVMVSPPTCGTFPSVTEMTAWTEPVTYQNDSSAFAITRGEAGGPCPSGLAPFSPGLEAGSINAQAAAHTPFFLHMTRADADQEITSYSATLPPGLLGKVAGIPYCPDAAIEAAKTRTGIEELEHPSCPAASQIGHTTSGYGVGQVLAYAPGGLYLAGPYHGAPISTVAIDSALVGPFDLGVVVVRSAIRVDPTSTQVSIDSAGSDPIPHILRGIPIHLRDIRVYIDRPDFTLNPTTCNPLATISALTGTGADVFSSADDVSANSTDRFQLANCASLRFRPKLRFRFTSGFSRRAYPSLRTELRMRPGEANLHFVSATLPRTEFTAQEHLRNICSKALFAAHDCPPNSVYGTAAAYSPLIDEPLRGPVYLRSAGGGGLPDMVFALKGLGGVEVDVVGRIDSVHESLRATFTNLPDAPVSKFVLNLYGKKKGLLQNEKNICNFPQFANVRMIGQNNTGEATKPRLETRCPKRARGRRGRVG